MRQRKKVNKFQRFIYITLVVILFESVAYFAKAFTSPPPILAQATGESTQSATVNHQEADFKLPILIYHYVEYVTDQRDTIRQSLNITPHTFESQIVSLKSAGYTFVTPNQIPKIEKGQYKVEKPIIISFDDGYRDFYTDVFPILKKHNIKAVTYVNPGLLDKLNYMYWDQLKEISQSGFVEIGAHGMSHRSLSSIDEKSAEWEITGSKATLEKELGVQVTSIAYPYGHYSDQVIDLVKSAGFSTGITTIEGTNENTTQKFTLKRIHPGARTGDDLLKIFN